MPDHPELAEVEGDEDAHDVELDQPGGLRVEGGDQDDRHHCEEHDAVAVGEPVAAHAQRPRCQAVLGQDRSQHREAVERRVGGQDQDQAGDHDDEVETRREVVEDRPGELGDDGVLGVVLRHRRAVGRAKAVEVVRVDVAQAHLAGQHDDADHHGHRDHAQQQERRGGVAALGLAERRHSVADGLDPGQGGTAGRERARQQQHEPDRGEWLLPALLRDQLQVGARPRPAGSRSASWIRPYPHIPRIANMNR